MSAATTAPAEADLSLIRGGMRVIIASTLQKVIAVAYATPQTEAALRRAIDSLEKAVEALERAIYNSSVRASRASRLPHRRLYADALRATNQALPAQVGPYPDDVVAIMYMDGRQTADEVVDAALAPAPTPDPRETTRRMFVRTLIGAASEYALDRERALETARTIEVSCFNAAVRASKESEVPPRRQWDSPAFVDIYSTRCGTIDGLLDPASSSCRAYGATLVVRLLAAPGGAISPLKPDALGDMTEAELCPQATVAERAEIAKRSEQKVTEKESNLFRCPHCGERRSTYREVQRRSLDEAPDYLCFCLSCRRRFTGRG